MEARLGDVVNVIGQFEVPPSSSSATPLPTIEVTSKANLVVHHPDILITATALSNAPQCRRKPLLQNFVRSTSEATPALVWGNILHEVMQTCLSEQCWEDRFIDARIAEVSQRCLGELLKIGVNLDQAKREVKARASGLQTFAQRYISQAPKEAAVLVNTRSERGQKSLLAISQLIDVEEDIWSPTYGLKGKLDASVQAVITDMDESSNPFAKARPTATTTFVKVPLEIKTGRAVAGMEHRAQTMLYTLLMAERYETEVPSGLLYYTQSEEVVRVPAARNEIKALIMARNEMAIYMMRRANIGGTSGKTGDAVPDVEANVEPEPFLPPTIDDVRTCGKCYVVDTCMLYRRAVENVVDDSSPISDIYDLKTSHLTSTQGEFFKKWEALISLEEQDLVRFKKELWTMGAAEREQKGRCFSNMVLDTSQSPAVKLPPTPTPTLKQEAKIHQFTYAFRKASSSAGQGSLLNGHMGIGDAVTVSVEPDLIAFVRGYILNLTPEEVILGVDHALSIHDIRKRRPRVGPVVFRIDRDELFGGMGRIRGNLAQLFYADGDTRRLELVVDLRSPVFDPLEGPIVPEHEPLSKVVAKLNNNQQEAMRRVLGARDYALILGMPGTGKTTVVSAIIKALVCMGKSVLLTSYTHSAVDTILLKLKDDADFGILRLGNVDKVHPDIHQYTLSARRTATNIEQLEYQVMTPPVVATTCLSIDHPLFSRRKFDYCIVDEASQITLPTCLGPLRYADKFVLVGDHFQLPPLVRSRDARKGGLDVSLFRRLSEAHPHAVVDLVDQYRMNEDIMLLSNKLIYSNRLRCGSLEVAKQGLVIPDRSFLQNLHSSSDRPKCDCWIEKLLDESCNAVFVDTDSVPALDSRVGDLVQNVTEARLVHQILESLVRSGIAEDRIGIISLYRQQLKLLSHLLQDYNGVEMLTADRSQGRDKDCIIISMVRSNETGQIGDLLKDWRRINVSFTRARSKLIIFGSRKTLQSAPLMEEFFSLMDERGWILKLPPGADKLHASLVGSPRKRPLDEASHTSSLEESESPRLQKKARKSVLTEEGLLRGRAILKDLVNERHGH
ncbi:hypothetical protein EW026_g3162 [Hermanssonia centrifuga]|uniref:DNA replication ATP-dependent helicase/nuclease n=1 Tax=Hermanssonia centrifuga TaxID=98765 RepID=A0A4S4KMZ6_9APHY|nr:hypothetical protein EW026_g3162 [Hermanssonia centrifuga]